MAYADIVFTTVFTIEIVLKVSSNLADYTTLFVSVDDLTFCFCPPDDRLWSVHAQGLLLPELLQHPGSDSGRGLPAFYGDGVSPRQL